MFIIDTYAISAQRTFDSSFGQSELIPFSPPYYKAIEPDYSSIIPASQLRRMCKAVRMGIGAGLPLIKRNNINGIVIGTANGGLGNCIEFLNQLVEYNEGMLTPTNFVQSTPNAIASQLAIFSKNTGYNSTHTNGSLAFENTLLDALLFLEHNQTPATLLLGSVEEISTYNYTIDFLSGRFKETLEKGQNPLLINSPGSVCGEGASMFIVSNNERNAIAKVRDVQTICCPQQNDIQELIEYMLNKNHLSITDIDMLMVGNNGDNRTDFWYSYLEDLFQGNPLVLTFKHLSGEYRTASGFAMYLGAEIFRNVSLINYIEPEKDIRQVNRILIYNHFDGIRHGFILLEKV